MYNVEITETLSRIVRVEAANAEEAIAKGWGMYESEAVVLDYSDHNNTEIGVVDNE